MTPCCRHTEGHALSRQQQSDLRDSHAAQALK